MKIDDYGIMDTLACKNNNIEHRRSPFKNRPPYIQLKALEASFKPPGGVRTPSDLTTDQAKV